MKNINIAMLTNDTLIDAMSDDIFLGMNDSNNQRQKQKSCRLASDKLAFARKHLLNNTISFDLRAISYLRITCSVMYYLELGNMAISSQKFSYLSLLNSLYNCQVEWWKHCQVSEEGILTSSIPEIEQLLQSLIKFHQKQLDL